MQDLPFLDLSRPGFSTRGPEVAEARRQSWVARTPFGLAILRHAPAGKILRDRRLRQGSHAWPKTVGLTGTFAEFWSRSVIGMEGASHQHVRRIAQSALSQDWIDALRPAFRAHADALVPEGNVEFMSAFAGPFAGQAICTLLGLPPSHGPSISHDATTLGRAIGLDAKTHQADINAACDRLMRLAADLAASARYESQTGYVARLLSAGTLPEQTLHDLIVITIFGGVDTTRAQLGLAMGLLADHPDQWHLLRTRPDLIPQALDETIRHHPTTTWSTRETMEDMRLDGLSIPSGTTIHILAQATATDPDVHDGRFDISLPRKIHFGFGGGAHHCLGQAVARADMGEALKSLTRQVVTLTRAGPPAHLPETGNTGPINLPLQMTHKVNIPGGSKRH